MKEPHVSIIIPLYVIENRFFEDLKKFDKLNYSNFEVIIVCDKRIELPLLKNKKTKFILTKKRQTGPAEKRDLAINKARGEICAFIDDDAYPDSNWLKNAVMEFNDPKISAVGGPGLTPPEDGFWEQTTGLVYSSFFCGGVAQYRFVKGKRKYVVDYPAYNLFVRTDVLKKVGGYGSYFYGGEDTFLCLKLIKAGYKILYSPKVVVYHHRRPLFFGYLKQIANVGKHRGYFAKHFPETSAYFWYFIPATLAIGFIFLLLTSLFSYQVRVIFLSLFLFFFILAWGSVIYKGPILNSFFAASGVILTHIFYGLSFIRGLTLKNLKR